MRDFFKGSEIKICITTEEAVVENKHITWADHNPYAFFGDKLLDEFIKERLCQNGIYSSRIINQVLDTCKPNKFLAKICDKIINEYNLVPYLSKNEKEEGMSYHTKGSIVEALLYACKDGPEKKYIIDQVFFFANIKIEELKIISQKQVERKTGHLYRKASNRGKR